LDAVNGLVKNLSWGFNSALFALPDLAYKKFAEANGLKRGRYYAAFQDF
jgi:hypothetical protein